MISALRRGGWCLAVLGFVIGCAGPAREVPTVAPLASDERPRDVEQAGTAELWDAVCEAAARDGLPRVGLLHSGDEALELRINLIRSARESVKIQTYIWEDSEVLKLLAWEMARAAEQRGVEVRLIADHIGSIRDVRGRARGMAFSDQWQVRVYNPLTETLAADPMAALSAALRDFRRVNQRMHTKLFIVDDRIAITGGRNYGNEYFDRAPDFSYLDRDVVLVGPAVREAVEKFDAFWDHELVVDSREMPDVKAAMAEIERPVDLTRADLETYGLFEELGRRAGDPDRIRAVFVDPLFAVNRVEWIIDSPGKPKDEHGRSETGAALRELVKSTRRELLIQTPYLVLDSRTQRMFKRYRESFPQVPIRISTNSLAAADNEPAYAMVYRQSRIHLQELDFDVFLLKPLPADIDDFILYGPLLSRKPTPEELPGLVSPRFASQHVPTGPFEATLADGTTRRFTSRDNPYLNQPPFVAIHAKSIVSDDVGFVGSYNFDPRSGQLNTEIGLIVHDAAFAAALKREIERAMRPENSWLLAKKRYPPGVHAANQLPSIFFDWFFLDPWPIRYGEAFELRPGAEPVPRGHPAFYERYKAVGDFPEVDGLSPGHLRTLFFTTLGPLATPLL